MLPLKLVNLSQKKAQRLFHQAYAAQRAHDFHRAIDLYQESIDCYPTAEAHTFLGWAYSFIGELDAAIEQCQEAILVDPELGNPYNDIGAYLIAQGRHEEAYDYLLQALRVSRYRACHYAYFNLGRVYEHRCDWFNAYRHYRHAIEIDSQYAIARYSLERVKKQMATQQSVSKVRPAQTSA